MSDMKRLIVLIGIMLGASALAIATTVAFLYDAGYERERARLVNLVETEALLIDALTGFHPTAAAAGETHKDGLQRVLAIHEILGRQATEPTEELLLGRWQGDALVVSSASSEIFDQRAHDPAVHYPARRADAGGARGAGKTMTGIGYHGQRVLAAFRPVAAGDIGLVAKMDVATINASYRSAAPRRGLVALVVIAAGILLIVAVTRPVLARLRESEARYRMLFDHIGAGAAVYEVVDDGADFRVRDLNCSAEVSDRYHART